MKKKTIWLKESNTFCRFTDKTPSALWYPSKAMKANNLWSDEGVTFVGSIGTRVKVRRRMVTMIKNDHCIGKWVWIIAMALLYSKRTFDRIFSSKSCRNSKFRYSNWGPLRYRQFNYKSPFFLFSRVVVMAKVDRGQHNNRFNDGKCDPQGRLWAGAYVTLLVP